jgi:hypothetical protein
LVRAALLLAFLAPTARTSLAEVAEKPSFDVVTAALVDYFASLKNYRAGDLLSQSQIAQALDRVEQTGWKVPNRDAIVQHALADNSFLVKELATPKGRQFMRHIGKDAGAYSRLDRLTTISHGRHLVHDLIQKNAGGYELIEYLATTAGGKNLGRMMAGAQQGVDLNKPTGRIYTADDLMAALQITYQRTSPR